MLKRFRYAAIAAALAITSATSASAALIRWDVNGTFASGATASGTVVWNTTTLQFDSWSIDVTGDTTLSAATYSNTVTGSLQFNLSDGLNFAGSTAGIGSLGFIAFSGDLFTRLADVLSPITFDIVDECRPNCGVRRSGRVASFTNGTDVTPETPTPIPLPAAWPLLAVGLAGLASMKRGRRKAA